MAASFMKHLPYRRRIMLSPDPSNGEPVETNPDLQSYPVPSRRLSTMTGANTYLQDPEFLSPMSGSLRATQVHAPESFPQVSRDPTSAPVFIFPSMGTITNGGNIAQYQNPFQNDNVERVFIPECNLNYFARVDLQSSESTVYQESLTSAVETRPYPYIRPTVRPGEYDPYGGNYASLTVISSTRGPVTIPFTVTPQPPNHQGIGMILGQSYFNAVSDINSMGRLDQIPQAINASHHGMHSQTAQRMAPPTFGDDLVTDFTSTQLPSSTMMSSGSSIGHLDTPSYNNYESLSNGYTYSDASYQDTLPSETNLTFGNGPGFNFEGEANE